MNVQCTTAELPKLLPMLAGLKSRFVLHITDAPVPSIVVEPVDLKTPAPAPALAPTPAPDVRDAAPTPDVKEAAPTRWYDQDEAGKLFERSSGAVRHLLARAQVPRVKFKEPGRPGRTRHYYDADKADALKALIDKSCTANEAAEMLGLTLGTIYQDVKKGRFTPIWIAGRMRFKDEDIQALMHESGIA
ncbi:TPA: helix-turn-helix domain-containing protein [Burkholderia vietnamiensis]|nr:helix-turn-helix domain-containing protein [Burkholderia vietnamiensis]